MPEERSRVFFALWPDETAREGLDQVTRRVHTIGGGRRMRRETLHMTLALIGEVPAERLEILRQAAGQVVAAAFMLRLDRLGCWRHHRIVGRWPLAEGTAG